MFFCSECLPDPPKARESTRGRFVCGKVEEPDAFRRSVLTQRAAIPRPRRRCGVWETEKAWMDTNAACSNLSNERARKTPAAQKIADRARDSLVLDQKNAILPLIRTRIRTLFLTFWRKGPSGAEGRCIPPGGERSAFLLAHHYSGRHQDDQVSPAGRNCFQRGAFLPAIRPCCHFQNRWTRKRNDSNAQVWAVNFHLWCRT